MKSNLDDINKKRIKVFLLTHAITGGGAEKVIANLSLYLDDEMDVQIVTLHDTCVYPINKPHICLQISSKLPGVISVPILQLLSIVRYRNLMNKYKPDISLSALSNDINVVASLWAGIPSIISLHSNPLWISNRDLGNNLFLVIGILLGKLFSKKIVAVSDSVRDVARSHYNISEKKIMTIYNPIEIDMVQKQSKEPLDDERINQSIPRIITVGRLSDVKGQWHLLRAFAKVHQTIKCQLLFCGMGGEQKYLENLSNELGVSDDVVFLGWQDNPYKYVSNSTVFVQSSLSETFGNVLIESLASGCPVIATGCTPAISEVLGENGSCAFITKKLSGMRHTATAPLEEGEEELAEYMLKILSEPLLSERMSKAGLEYAKQFGLEKSIEQYKELFLEIAGNNT